MNEFNKWLFLLVEILYLNEVIQNPTDEVFNILSSKLLELGNKHNLLLLFYNNAQLNILQRNTKIVVA